MVPSSCRMVLDKPKPAVKPQRHAAAHGAEQGRYDLPWTRRHEDVGHSVCFAALLPAGVPACLCKGKWNGMSGASLWQQEQQNDAQSVPGKGNTCLGKDHFFSEQLLGLPRAAIHLQGIAFSPLPLP